VAIKIIDKVMMAERAKKEMHRRIERAKKVARKAEAEQRSQESPKNPAISEELQGNTIRDVSNQPTLFKNLNSEVKLLMRLSHPNIVQLYQVIDTDNECYVIMWVHPS
jgi:serine/threonine protein kinase